MSSPRKLVLLEGLRGFAAFYVVLHHFNPFAGTPWSILTRFGQEAVVVFFLLSGFVIHYSFARSRDRSPRGYFVARIRRIYPLLLLAFSLSIVVRLIVEGVGADLAPRQLLMNFLMLQDNNFLRPGSFADPYLGNLPLWSLSYECWFYTLYFFINRNVSENHQLRWIAGLAALGLGTFFWVPNFASRVLFILPVWWLGVEMARGYLREQRVTFRVMHVPLIVTGVIGIGATLHAVWLSQFLDTSAGRFPWIEARLVGVGFLLCVSGIWWQRGRFWGIRQFVRPFAILAPFSYALYVFHSPILALWRAEKLSTGFVGLGLSIGLIVALSYTAEIWLQPYFKRIIR